MICVPHSHSVLVTLFPTYILYLMICVPHSHSVLDTLFPTYILYLVICVPHSHSVLDTLFPTYILYLVICVPHSCPVLVDLCFPLSPFCAFQLGIPVLLVASAARTTSASGTTWCVTARRTAVRGRTRTCPRVQRSACTPNSAAQGPLSVWCPARCVTGTRTAPSPTPWISLTRIPCSAVSLSGLSPLSFLPSFLLLSILVRAILACANSSGICCQSFRWIVFLPAFLYIIIDIHLFSLFSVWHPSVFCLTAICSLCFLSDISLFSLFPVGHPSVLFVSCWTSVCSLCSLLDILLFSLFPVGHPSVLFVSCWTSFCSLCFLFDFLLYSLFPIGQPSVLFVSVLFVSVVLVLTALYSLCFLLDIHLFSLFPFSLFRVWHPSILCISCLTSFCSLFPVGHPSVLCCPDLTRGWSCDNHTTNNCEHYCHQYEHGVRCSCRDGFELNDNGYSCDGQWLHWWTPHSHPTPKMEQWVFELKETLILWGGGGGGGRSGIM